MKAELFVLYCLFKETGMILPKKSFWASPYLTPLNSTRNDTVLVTARASDWSDLSCHSQDTTWVYFSNQQQHLHFISWCSSFPSNIRIFVPASAVCIFICSPAITVLNKRTAHKCATGALGSITTPGRRWGCWNTRLRLRNSHAGKKITEAR